MARRLFEVMRDRVDLAEKDGDLRPWRRRCPGWRILLQYDLCERSRIGLSRLDDVVALDGFARFEGVDD